MAPPNTKEFNDFSIKVMSSLASINQQLKDIHRRMAEDKEQRDENRRDISSIKQTQKSHAVYISIGIAVVSLAIAYLLYNQS